MVHGVRGPASVAGGTSRTAARVASGIMVTGQEGGRVAACRLIAPRCAAWGWGRWRGTCRGGWGTGRVGPTGSDKLCRMGWGRWRGTCTWVGGALPGRLGYRARVTRGSQAGAPPCVGMTRRREGLASPRRHSVERARAVACAIQILSCWCAETVRGGERARACVLVRALPGER